MRATGWLTPAFFVYMYLAADGIRATVIMNANDYIDGFISYIVAERNYSKLTAEGYATALNEFLTFIETAYGIKDWADVDADHIREWVVELMTGQLPVTVNKKLSALRSFYKFMLIRGYVTTDPTRKVKGPKGEKHLPVFVRESDMDTLLDKVEFCEDYEGLRDRLIILLLYSTGMRLAELVGLNVSSIDFYSSSVKVLGKRNKERLIPFGAELREALQAYLDVRAQQPQAVDNAALFPGKRGLRITRETVSSVVKKYLSQVSTARKLSPHVLRHTFATAMLNNGAEVEVVRQLLGHESIATTEVYTHVTFEELKKVYAKAHPRADKKD